jgi:hypothetical protein
VVSSHRRDAAFAAAVAAYAAYTTWFISVWCCFAALLSVIVAWHFRARRPAPATA